MPTLRGLTILTCLAALLGLNALGCRSSRDVQFDDTQGHYRATVQQIEYPDVPVGEQVFGNPETLRPPPTVRNFDQIEYSPLTLEDAIRMAIDSNETVRQLGGSVVRSTASTATIYDPAIIETDPRFGVEQALAAFDAQIGSRFSVGVRERQLNLPSELRYRSDQPGTFSLGVGKIAATGTEVRADYTTNYLSSNWPFNRVPSIFETVAGISVKHPLMQGGGIEFNRIAGPNGAPGNMRGIMIARVLNDVALVDFQLAVRNLLREVERGYWELYFAYRDLDAKLEGRRNAYESWEIEKMRLERGQGRPDQEAFAREQYYAAQVAVENAISGERGTGGVLSAERDLRSLIGLTASDGKLLRPSTPPLTTDIQFDWEESLHHAIDRREELRRQRWKVKQRELEATAARNFTLPQLNAIGQYHWRGFGDDLVGQSDAATNNLFTGELQGWLMGVEFMSPVGRRAGNSALRNAELWLRREQALLLEQERQVGLELRGAFAELDRAYVVTRSAYNRHIAAQVQLEAERIRNREGQTALNLVLDAQRRAVIAEIQFHRAVVDYNQAVSLVNLTRGTLMESLNVYLTEGPWTIESHISAQRQANRLVPRSHPVVDLPPPVSVGEYPQHVEEADAPAVEIVPPGPPAQP